MTANAQKSAGNIGFMLLPAKPGTCAECATKHEPHEPHNQASLHYQYYFYGQHGRWPTWPDAMAHCDDAIRANWKRALEARGINLPECESHQPQPGE